MESFKLVSKHFPRLLSSCSVMYGNAVPETEKQNFSTTFPLVKTMDPDLEGLKVILSYDMTFSKPFQDPPASQNVYYCDGKVIHVGSNSGC